jgi:hypothetical protein
VSAGWRSTAAPSRGAGRLVALAITVAVLASAVHASDRGPDVSPLAVVGSEPAGDRAADADHVLLVSTRALGTRCDAHAMAAGLHCERLAPAGGHSPRRWESISWNDVAADFATPLPTVVYVHGNRVSADEERAHGLALYRQLAAKRRAATPVRYIIWSWPADQLRRPVKDYQVKAARTRPVGWQLAWAVDQWPAESPVALVGYSYGARVVTGALHILAGGELDGLRLDRRAHPGRPPVRAALIAAALHADWLQPHGYHGRALEQVDRLLLINNQRDPAMRFYRLAMEDRHVQALGYAGIVGRASLGQLAERVQAVDATDAVGRSHALVDYLTAAGPTGRMLEHIVVLPAPDAGAGAAALAGRQRTDERQ